MQIAETSRLILSKVLLEDAPLFIKIMNTPEFIDYVGDRKIKTIKDAENHLNKNILKSYNDNGFGVYKLTLKDDLNTSVGICGLFKRKELEHVDIGFGFAKEYYGKGYGYESSVEVMKLAKEKFNIKTLVAITSPRNIASQNLLKKLGMTLEKRINPWKEPEDLLLFAKEL